MLKQIPEASLSEPYKDKPQIIEQDGAKTWLVRSKTFVVAVSEVKESNKLFRQNNPDEYMLYISDGMKCTINANGETLTSDCKGDALIIVPPGPSDIVFHDDGYIARLFSSRANDLAMLSLNADKYADIPQDVSPPPEAPPKGFKIRHYAMEEHKKPDGPARPFRSTNLMMNAFVPRDFRRDPRKMTPHLHDDFDQASLALQGSFVHHLRYPWIVDMTQWREDQHLEVGSPSVVIIPEKAIHTTQDIGVGWAQLIDIFAPPRADFNEKPGWVCNEDDYPL